MKNKMKINLYIIIAFLTVTTFMFGLMFWMDEQEIKDLEYSITIDKEVYKLYTKQTYHCFNQLKKDTKLLDDTYDKLFICDAIIEANNKKDTIGCE